MDMGEFQFPLLMFKHRTGHVRVYQHSVYHHEGKVITKVVEDLDIGRAHLSDRCVNVLICPDANNSKGKSINVATWTCEQEDDMDEIFSLFNPYRNSVDDFHNVAIGVSTSDNTLMTVYSHHRLSDTPILCKDFVRLSRTRLLVSGESLSIWELNCPIRALLSLLVCTTKLPIKSNPLWEPRLIGLLAQYVIGGQKKNTKNKKRKRVVE